jgi:type I restriction enzyme S subunit
MSGWTFAPIRSVVENKETWNPGKDNRTYAEYLEISGIDNSLGQIISTRTINVASPPSRAKRVIRKGDVVFGTTRPYLKNIAVVPENLDGHVCSTGFCVLRPKRKKVLPEWLYGICRSDVVVDQVIPGQEKHAYPAVSDDAVLDSLIPVPPLDEQSRIVARIEGMTRRAEKARKLRQEAVAEVNHIFQTELERVFLPIETDGWTEYDARDVFDIVKGQVNPQEEPYASMQHIAPDVIETGTGRFIEDKIKTAAELELKSGKYLFNASHVLYSKIRPNLRKVVLPDFEGTCSADMYPLIPNPEVVTREFFALVLLSPPFTDYAVENSDRNAMPKVNRPTMFGYKVKLPGLAEQKEIVARIRTLQNRAEEISKIQLSVDEELRVFESALLAKVFRGAL